MFTRPVLGACAVRRAFELRARIAPAPYDHRRGCRLPRRPRTGSSAVPAASAKTESPAPSAGDWQGRGTPEEFYPRLGFIETNMSRPAERAVAFYNKRGTSSNGSRKAKARSNGCDWMRLSCGTSAANALRLQLHALAYNLDNFLRMVGRYVAFQNGRGRHPTANVPGDFAAHRGTAAAATTSAGVRRSIVMRSRATSRRSASDSLDCRSHRHLASGPPANPENRYHPRQFGALIRGILTKVDLRTS